MNIISVNNQRNPAAFLFDLDGTLLDTAPDLLAALNHLRLARGLPPMPLSAIRAIANQGSKAMLKLAFDVDMNEDKTLFMTLREAFLALYDKHLADSTLFFPQVHEFLLQLEERRIPWGIVTNKPSRQTHALLQALNITHRPACIVCGDTTSEAKPSPLPLLYACEQLALPPKDCLFIGDAATDIQAGKAAGMKSLVALYGYIDPNEDPYSWGADGYLAQISDLYEWMHPSLQPC